MTHIVYGVLAGSTIVYVGVTANLSQRINNHRWLSVWWMPCLDVVELDRGTYYEASQAERRWVRSERPMFNIQLNTDYRDQWPSSKAHAAQLAKAAA